jgi:hypothetical protein
MSLTTPPCAAVAVPSSTVFPAAIAAGTIAAGQLADFEIPPDRCGVEHLRDRLGDRVAQLRPHIEAGVIDDRLGDRDDRRDLLGDEIDPGPR